MTISIPDTFTLDHSENYIMSIRLWSGGLSFSAYHPQEAQSFIYREITFDRHTPYITSLKELFFANELFAWNYKRTYVLYVSPQYTLVPKEVFVEKEKETLMSFTFSSREKRTMSNPIKDEQAELLFDLNEDIFEFCSRSLTNPIFIHHVTPLLITLKRQSLTDKQKQTSVVIHKRMIDIICFAEGQLLFANSFMYEQADDLLYYILYVWRQTRMDQLHDRLSLSGETALCNEIAHKLQTYLQHIGQIEIPSEAYLLGGEILQAPIDQLFLSVCEL
ncbi:hypothetical protein M2459_002749 [Parabacteroides sp. PF5-5]|uniref:DUF3822 family protein n=1 Tax=unclassified Parabacteroides TaxID=2649774 RepID=UPI0024754558|nr:MULTISPECIES: DUF3822 family protein [unclassified Parabacteroides]MDH6306107.1 hypothetical protein [Parabacteroides sp. PH5-39]MDH6316995.1 hypothetical protein [Parabacteroides sp. PF5-13]MDH6320748.1 hypothetical protein [Parabacteroides sp. PH5-13]MDH6324550.1 hypothetical protein [Parabacteroides sp. PH5-8]MDH6328180.1 hypothetical protein [Parabacteroides sp. PH5-41]